MPWLGVLIWVSVTGRAAAAGGQKLWGLGEMVEENPITVTVMFGCVVVLTIAMEHVKHAIEHRTTDPYRKRSLEAVYVELMLVGVVSFLLILAAELGLTDVRLPIGACEVEGSGSGAEEVCGAAFDIVLFEFAHLTLFFMGLAYCAFIFVSFRLRDRQCLSIFHAQRRSLAEWNRRRHQKGWRKRFTAERAWSILVVRGAMVIQHDALLRSVCSQQEKDIAAEIASIRGLPPPRKLPPEDGAANSFDISIFLHHAMSETMLELLHIHWLVWVAVLVMAALTNLKWTHSVADNMMYSAGLPLVFSVVLWWRVKKQLEDLAYFSWGHSRLALVGHVPEEGLLHMHPSEGIGKAWENGGLGPWEMLKQNRRSPLHPSSRTMKWIIQITVSSACFYIGLVVMMSALIIRDLGVGALLLCLTLPLLALVYFIPQATLMFTLVTASRTPKLRWLRESLVTPPDPAPGLSRSPSQPSALELPLLASGGAGGLPHHPSPPPTLRLERGSATPPAVFPVPRTNFGRGRGVARGTPPGTAPWDVASDVPSNPSTPPMASTVSCFQSIASSFNQSPLTPVKVVQQPLQPSNDPELTKSPEVEAVQIRAPISPRPSGAPWPPRPVPPRRVGRGRGVRPLVYMHTRTNSH
eukprot:Sspe_Gene.28537::Locus_13007_Transcript_1_1_Confidence_1.000_Length_2348::g.28537::m.28537